MVNLTYSFIFLTRRNYNLINDDIEEQEIRNVFKEVSERLNLKLVKFGGNDNYVEFSIITSNPNISPAQISHYLRTNTSAIIRNNILFDKSNLPSLWIRDNWIGTMEPSKEDIIKFVSN